MTDRVSAHSSPGWIRTGEEIDGVPILKRRDESCYIAAGDADQLRFIMAALTRFDHMTGPEFHAFMTS